MAEKAPPQAGKTPAPKGKSSRLGSTLLLIALIPLALMYMSLTTVLVVGMLPTMAAFIVDPDRRGLAPLTVGALNFAGTLHFLILTLTAGHSMDSAIHILSDPLSWIIMYGAAGVGWGFYFGIPPTISTFIAMRAQMEISSATAKQKELIEAWGDEIHKLYD